MERSGELCLLRELNCDPNIVGKYVRVTGYVSSVDTISNFVEIIHDDDSLGVDISLVDTGSLKIDNLVQFIGEIKPSSQGQEQGKERRIYLAAKIFRAVDGLDMRLYEEALLARREFLTSA